MTWHDIRDPNDPLLDELARQYNLHPLHIEDCRNRNQAAKIEPMNDYLFIVLKPVDIDKTTRLRSPISTSSSARIGSSRYRSISARRGRGVE